MVEGVCVTAVSGSLKDVFDSDVSLLRCHGCV